MKASAVPIHASNQIKYRLLQSIEDCLNNVITLYNNIDAKGLREASLLNPKPFINTNNLTIIIMSILDLRQMNCSYTTSINANTINRRKSKCSMFEHITSIEHIQTKSKKKKTQTQNNKITVISNNYT